MIRIRVFMFMDWVVMCVVTNRVSVFYGLQLSRSRLWAGLSTAIILMYISDSSRLSKPPSGAEPTLAAETHRRAVENDVVEMWYYLWSQLQQLKQELEASEQSLRNPDKDADQFSLHSVVKRLDDVFETAVDYKRCVFDFLFSVWRFSLLPAILCNCSHILCALLHALYLLRWKTHLFTLMAMTADCKPDSRTFWFMQRPVQVSMQ